MVASCDRRYNGVQISAAFRCYTEQNFKAIDLSTLATIVAENGRRIDRAFLFSST